ncbi:calcium-activated chloride channel regulator 1-like [Discoglossus pictus]
MMLGRIYLQIVLMLLAFQFNTASKVRLRGNGYEDLVIGINPQVQENLQIISNIKDMVTEASLYLYNATKRRFYYREVKILIPPTWQHLDYQRPKHEAYGKASIIISNQNLNYGSDPYTLHYKGCGKEGQYIHFSPDFLTDDNLISVYGSRGRVFVHEWAHYRWGVYDEYSYETPFFISVERKIKATRCSSEIAGMYICKKTSCSDGNCVFNPQTGNLEAGCMFLVNSTQKVKSSIMYMQALSSVGEFCDESNHDREAPNMQNKMCSYRSTWNVIKSSSDFRSTLPMSDNTPPPILFSLLQTRVRTICLVLDASANMATDERFRKLQQAAAIFLLHIVETGSHVGIVSYNETAEIRSPLRQIVNNGVRRNLTSYLTGTSNGGTNICLGILSGLEVLKCLDGSTDGSEIIVVASGTDLNLNSCFSDVSLSGSVIHTIAIGPNVDTELEHLAEITGGYSFFVSDVYLENSLIDAFTEMSSADGNTVGKSIKLESISRLISAGGQFIGIVTIDSTLGNDTTFIFTWEAPELPIVTIQDPTGYNYTREHFEYDTVSHVIYLCVPGTSEVGIWKYKIINTYNSGQALGVFVTSRASSETNPHVTIKADIDKNVVTFPSPVIVSAEVKQGFSSVLGVNVTAIIEPELGSPIFLTLADDGAGADVSKDDGIYSRYVFSFPQNGRYALRIDAELDNTATLITQQNSPAMYVPGYIENDTINMNPPRQSVSEIQSTIQSFRRIINAGSFHVTNVSYQTVDVFPPCRVTDLDAKMESGVVQLSWTAPGDNYDQGIASSYEIRISNNPVELRENFFSATVINTSTLQPQNAGIKETFSFIAQNISNVNDSITYIAICTMDKASLRSEVSNLVQIVRHVQSENISFVHSTANVKYNGTKIIVIIVSLCLVCLVLAAALYVFKWGSFHRLPHQIIDTSQQRKYKVIEETPQIDEGREQMIPLKIKPKSIFHEKVIVHLENHSEV